MIAPPPQPGPCPHCRRIMEPGFLFCRQCWSRLPFDLKTRLWTDQSRAHHKTTFPAGPEWLAASLAKAIQHLTTQPTQAHL